MMVIPVGILILVVLRNIVGVKTFGTFMPVLIALAFRQTGLVWGIAFFSLVVAIGLAARFYLEQLKLLLVPRLACIVIVVILAIAMLTVLSFRLGLESDIRRIGDAADKMERLLNDLLELSRVGRIANQPQSVDLNTMIPEVLELLHGRIHARNIRVLVQSDLPKVYGDRPRLMEIWQNLIDNAAKFMGDQPTPHVEIGQAGTAVDGSPVFFVRDNGLGIDPKFHDRVFGLFDKLDPRSGGTGIGLAIVKRIVEVHGGSIWVESEPGQGATFFFTLARQET